ncbi:hypothetical protein LMG26411_07924 [Cupriavidus numazuensis]|uniref:Uncharacterized protein n=1 Tax=Cupriavidus numazuensis TaxID=221992 RepID=A0ABM8TW65_9BURK|nr:hypothetical protein LMG26411_07924 [Cupriavidus numazuensis]
MAWNGAAVPNDSMPVAAKVALLRNPKRSLAPDTHGKGLVGRLVDFRHCEPHAGCVEILSSVRESGSRIYSRSVDCESIRNINLPDPDASDSQ